MATLEIPMKVLTLAKHLHAAMRDWQWTHNGNPNSPPEWSRLSSTQEEFWQAYAQLLIGRLAKPITQPPHTELSKNEIASHLLSTHKVKS